MSLPVLARFFATSFVFNAFSVSLPALGRVVTFVFFFLCFSSVDRVLLYAFSRVKKKKALGRVVTRYRALLLLLLYCFTAAAAVLLYCCCFNQHYCDTI